jgi:hypothetical protein
MFLARFMRPRPPSACAQGAKKRPQATKCTPSHQNLRVKHPLIQSIPATQPVLKFGQSANRDAPAQMVVVW